MNYTHPHDLHREGLPAIHTLLHTHTHMRERRTEILCFYAGKGLFCRYGQLLFYNLRLRIWIRLNPKLENADFLLLPPSQNTLKYGSESRLEG